MQDSTKLNECDCFKSQVTDKPDCTCSNPLPDTTDKGTVPDNTSLNKCDSFKLQVINGTTSGCSSPCADTIASSTNVSSIESFPVYYPDPSLPIHDIKNSLSRHIQTKYGNILKACKNFDRKSTGKISRSHLKQVLRTFCLPLTAVQFDALTAELNENIKGKVDYKEFFKSISGVEDDSSFDDSNIESAQEHLPIDEIELRIRQKITPIIQDVVRSFWLFDHNKDGYIQKKELRKILENYCFIIKDSQYNELWKRYDPQNVGIINYKDFLVKLGVSVDRYKKYMPRETVARALCWVDEVAQDFTNSLRYEQRKRRAALEKKDDPVIHGLPMEETEDIFLRKLRRSAEVLKRTFKMFDFEDTGLISVNDFHGVLNSFIMPMSPGLFDDMMKRMNIEIPPTKKIKWKEFLERFCRSDPDVMKLGSQEFLKLDKCITVIERIKNHILNPEARLKSVFTHLDQENNWKVTRQELRKAIEQSLDFTLTDDEFQELTTILDPGHTNFVDCRKFLCLFENDIQADIKARKVGASLRDEFHLAPAYLGEKYKNLQDKKLRSKLKYHLNKNMKNIERRTDENEKDTFYSQLQDILNSVKKGDISLVLGDFNAKVGTDSELWAGVLGPFGIGSSNGNEEPLLQALLSCDQDQSGLIDPRQLREIIQNFCFPITDKQFDEIMSNFKVFRDRMHYHDFLEIYKKKPEEDTEKWIRTVEKLVPFKSKCSPSLTVEEAEEVLRESVRSKMKGLLKDFQILDICKVGVAYKDDVRRLFNKYAMRMNDQQFNTLWKKFPLNTFGQLMYEEFLCAYSKPMKKIQSSTPPPVQRDVRDRLLSGANDRKQEMPSSSTESVKKGHDYQTELEESPRDPGFVITPEQEEEMLQKQREALDKALNERRITRVVPRAKWGKPAGENTTLKDTIIKDAPELLKTFSSMKIPIIAHFREIRHRFRRTDPKITGRIDFVQFQTVLRQSGVYLNDEQVFHILEYFDPHLTGKISYRDFLRVFVWYA